MSQTKFVSNWKGVESVPETYVYPPEKRFGVSVKKTIPVIDWAIDDRTLLLKKVHDVTQEFGFVQVINHGVPKTLVEETMKILKEFHAMSPEDKERECSKDPDHKSCRVYSSSQNYETEQIHLWKDTLKLTCHPNLDENVQFWPQNPPKFREVVKAYLLKIEKFALEILEVLSEGLGLEKGYLRGEMSKNPELFVHHYPPCPNPSLTIGLNQHADPTLITILFQDVNGLQFLKDGQWIDVDPLPNAFLVNLGYVLEVISNGKMKAVEHRVVTNTTTSRQSLAYVVYPGNDVNIEPSKCFINEANPPHYLSLEFKDFIKKLMSKPPDRETALKFISFNQP
ncbi:hyoscyamine 6-dioxygenase-like [Cucumis melo]|uniref:Hyoscyamine 6-dioxygenase-like n=1 Tax=Cucumis melo TaxID=3656 RepID=A0A1S3BRU2_CUCME|nr:hyoscyamine 6-dioxygenase-like [Cucumis melo]